MKERNAAVQDLIASLFQLLGVLVFAVGAYKAWPPLGIALLGLFVMLVGRSIDPATEETKDRGLEHR